MNRKKNYLLFIIFMFYEYEEEKVILFKLDI